MSPSFNSGVGFELIISLAIDQIFCFAPSIKPPIEPVVSRTKQTSMRGLVLLAAAVFARHECELAATNARGDQVQTDPHYLVAAALCRRLEIAGALTERGGYSGCDARNVCR